MINQQTAQQAAAVLSKETGLAWHLARFNVAGVDDWGVSVELINNQEFPEPYKAFFTKHLTKYSSYEKPGNKVREMHLREPYIIGCLADNIIPEDKFYIVTAMQPAHVKVQNF